MEKINASDSVGAGLHMRILMGDVLSAKGHFSVECFDVEGNLKWSDEIHNLVTTVGKNDLLDKYISGTAYTQTIRMGLKGVGTAVVGDTQASHASWAEQGLANAPTYSGNRPVPSFSLASAGSKTTSVAVAFNITGAGTVAGCFINNGGSATKDDTTGILFSAGDFSGGSRVVANLDVLNVTYTLSV